MKTKKAKRSILALVITLVMAFSVFGSTMTVNAATTGIKTFQNFENSVFVSGDLPDAAYNAWGGTYCLWLPDWFDQSYAIDGTGMGQGNNVLEVMVSESNSGKFAFRTFALPEDAAGFKALDGMALYLKLPESNYTAAETAGFRLDIKFANAAGADKPVTNATITYYFKDGSKLVKTAQNGLYPYNKAGNITDAGFEGYVTISYEGLGLTDADFNSIYLDMPLTESIALLGKSVYVDDFVEYDSDAIVAYINTNLGIVTATPSVTSSATSSTTSQNPTTGDSNSLIYFLIMITVIGIVSIIKRKTVSIK